MTTNMQNNKHAEIRHYLLATSERAFQIDAQLCVIQEAAFNAVNEGAENLDDVLERIKHLARMGESAAQDLAHSLNDKAVAIADIS